MTQKHITPSDTIEPSTRPYLDSLKSEPPSDDMTQKLKDVGVVLKDGMFLNTISPTRKFDTGATRDQDTTKLDFEGFLSPLALTRFATYMHEHRVQSDGTLRGSDNWQKGIPLESYMKSMWRHLITVWRHHREVPAADCESQEDALCGVIFNAQGYLHEIMKAKGEE